MGSGAGVALDVAGARFRGGGRKEEMPMGRFRSHVQSAAWPATYGRRAKPVPVRACLCLRLLASLVRARPAPTWPSAEIFF
jgi:hypothetical protein